MKKQLNKLKFSQYKGLELYIGGKKIGMDKVASPLRLKTESQFDKPTIQIEVYLDTLTIEDAELITKYSKGIK